MDDEDSSSEEEVRCGSAVYPEDKLRRVQAIFMDKQHRKSRRLPAHDTQKAARTTKKHAETSPESTSSEDDVRSTRPSDSRVFPENAGKLVDCTRRLRKLCTKCTPEISIDAHLDALNESITDDRHRLQRGRHELQTMKKAEEGALRAQFLQLQLSMVQRLEAMEAEFCNNVEHLTKKLESEYQSQLNECQQRLTMACCKLKTTENTSATHAFPSSLRRKSCRAASDRSRFLQMSFSPEMLERAKKALASKSKPAHETESKTWPTAPLSPNREKPSTWKHGISRESTEETRSIARKLDSRFLNPAEAKELMTLQDVLGKTTAWMEKALL
ncbi:hypothetical protein AeMF1_015448 [Aphanomyces euteiches]|nr:hypothetical protein AeMF1_015448 [Aphanomyces euteiches]KAH9190160.1 hypothetical protein AeNC1_007867 [Aphanomyces euteiches]